MTDFESVLNFKNHKMADVAELINSYIDHNDEIISDEELIRMSKPLMQEGQKTPFQLFIKEARAKIRKDLINDVTEFTNKLEISTLLERIAQYFLNNETATKLQELGIDKYESHQGYGL